ncbi:hypothetical protein Tco_1266546 [Tanacetum coccineum]
MSSSLEDVPSLDIMTELLRRFKCSSKPDKRLILIVKSEKSERLSEEAKRSALKRFDSKEARRFTRARKSVKNSSASTSRTSTSTTSTSTTCTSTTLNDESNEDLVDEDDIVDLGNDGEIKNENLDDYSE